MGISDIENVSTTAETVELDGDYSIAWTKERVQILDANYSFEFYKGSEDGGSLVFYMKESKEESDPGYYLDVRLSFDVDDNDFALLSERYNVETLEHGFELAEKINSAFARLYERGE